MTKITVKSAIKEEKWWTVQTTEGAKYSMFLNIVPSAFEFENGKEYEVELKDRDYNGKTYWNIVAVAGQEAQGKKSGGGGWKKDPERDKAIAKMHDEKVAGIARSVALNNAVLACINFGQEGCKSDTDLKNRIFIMADHFVGWLNKKE